ncbi:MAG: ABC transporter ATP-binding protein [bacterium]
MTGGETAALADISFVVRDGEFISIVGPSGCGKSTLLSVIAGLVRPTVGRAYIDGSEVSEPSRKIGYMLQQDYLFEWRTIFGNALLGPEIQGKATPETRRRVSTLLDKYGLGAFKDHYPRQLSGGMRQRAALIRTMAVDPEIFLLDEPFSALDYQTRLTLEGEVHQILRQAGKTVILVTHDISEAISLSDRVIVISRRPGTIKSDHPIRLTGTHLTPFTAREAPEFNTYFDLIWEELDVRV